jgi:UDP-N-acetylmuramate--alanine ligase
MGIGGTGVGPLAIIARQAGYEVSGSDLNKSEYTKNLQTMGISVTIGDPSIEEMAAAHSEKPIDWVVSVSAIVRQRPDHPVFVFARENGIQITERDACLNRILNDKKLKMIAAAGTHGKTTTTAMFVWAFTQLGIPISYSVGAKMSFADMGHYEPESEYFVYECDEFHRNFLNFYPHLSVISGITWDHHEVFPTRGDYKDAFLEYIAQTGTTLLWDNDAEYIGLHQSATVRVLASEDPEIASLTLAGLYNRRDAWLVVEAVHAMTNEPKKKIIDILNQFPGTSRRMEELMPGLFSDYAHTPEKIVGGLSVALETAQKRGKNVVIVYEPLTNRRQHFMKDEYKDCFDGAQKVYWVPSYLAREDPDQEVLSPAQLIARLDDPTIATPAEPNDALWNDILHELEDSIVVCMSGGGGNSLDEWARDRVRSQLALRG